MHCRPHPLEEGGLGPRLTQCGLRWCKVEHKWKVSRQYYAGSPSNTMSPGPRPTPYQVESWSIQLFGHSRYGLKIGGAVPLRRRGAGSLSNTMWSAVICGGLRFPDLPSGVVNTFSYCVLYFTRYKMAMNAWQSHFVRMVCMAGLQSMHTDPRNPQLLLRLC